MNFIFVFFVITSIAGLFHNERVAQSRLTLSQSSLAGWKLPRLIPLTALPEHVPFSHLSSPPSLCAAANSCNSASFMRANGLIWARSQCPLKRRPHAASRPASQRPHLRGPSAPSAAAQPPFSRLPIGRTDGGRLGRTFAVPAELNTYNSCELRSGLRTYCVRGKCRNVVCHIFKGRLY